MFPAIVPVITTAFLINLYSSFYGQVDSMVQRKAQKKSNIKTTSGWLKTLAVKFTALFVLNRLDIFHKRLRDEGEICIYHGSSTTLSQTALLVGRNCAESPERVFIGRNNSNQRIQFTCDSFTDENDNVDFDCLWHSSEFSQVIKSMYDQLYQSDFFVIRRRSYYDGQYHYSIYLRYYKKN